MYTRNTRSGFFFSPSAIQASLQTSTVQVCNGKFGVDMPLIRKSDVKTHFSARRMKRLHLIQLVNKPNGELLPAAKIENESKQAAFVDDFLLVDNSGGAQT
jgi:hypothetical protein